MTAGKEFKFDKCTLKIGINAENLLNRKYYDHTSYYRLIDVPEPGRNVAVMVGLDF
jgi:iron complex outermembrane receptor protein